jgi:hypothetical protein
MIHPFISQFSSSHRYKDIVTIIWENINPRIMRFHKGIKAPFPYNISCLRIFQLSSFVVVTRARLYTSESMNNAISKATAEISSDYPRPSSKYSSDSPSSNVKHITTKYVINTYIAYVQRSF